MGGLPLFWLSPEVWCCCSTGLGPAWTVESSSASSSWLTAAEEKGTTGSHHPG